MAGRYLRNLRRRFVHRIVGISDTPRAIALGVAIGVFIAMTPTVGVQLIAAALICTLVRANRIAACLLVFISNPFTMLPIYWIDYWLGAHLTSTTRMTRADFDALWQRILDAGMIGGIREGFHTLVGDLGPPMMIGGVILGLALAVPSYPLTYRAIRLHRRRREARIAYERLRELRGDGARSSVGGAPNSSSPGELPWGGVGSPERLPEIQREEWTR